MFKEETGHSESMSCPWEDRITSCFVSWCAASNGRAVHLDDDKWIL